MIIKIQIKESSTLVAYGHPNFLLSILDVLLTQKSPLDTISKRGQIGILF